MSARHLYVHVPFCTRRCVYCDFSIAVRSTVPVSEYVDALDRELSLRRRDANVELETLYLGGGTPSKLGGDGVARLADVIRRHAMLDPEGEFTLEANPEDVTRQAARAWRDAGVNRVSLGVQSFDDAVLTWMHRTHDARAAREAVEVLHEIGMANVSLDLIFAVPSAVPRSWERDLEIALSLDVSHLSLYGLTIEPHTPLGRWVARQEVTEAPEENFECQFLRAHDELTSAGFEHYEVSNYGRSEHHSRHNWAYWERKPYVGVGPSAHDFDGRIRRWNAAYSEWLRRLSGSHDPVAGCEELSEEQTQAEQVYLGLRTNRGVETKSMESERIASWVDAGWAIRSESALHLTPLGWLRLDAIATDLTQRPSRY